MRWREAIREWRELVAGNRDQAYRRESWSAYVDHLVKAGRVPEARARTWRQPPENRA